ncbi:MAG: glycosyltransferase family 2 protein [Gaiellaceae bacterium]
MKITGISIVRDEADIVRMTLLHRLAIGCDNILVIDNGSTDDTPRVLEKLSRRYPVEWVSHDEPFRQAKMATELAREAARAGADWVVPFDADEFWWARTKPLRSLLEESSAGVLESRVVNFVQRRRQRRSSRSCIARMTWRAETVVSPTNPHFLVEAGTIAYVEGAYPPKQIARATAGIEISKGSHEIRGVPGPLELTDDLVCLHAPLRSRNELKKLAATAPRVWEESPDPGTAWQQKRWGRLASEGGLAEEWAANSQRRGNLDLMGMKRTLVFDTLLCDLVAPWLPLPQRLFRQLARLQRRSPLASEIDL